MNKIITNIMELIKDNKAILEKVKKEDDEIFTFEFNINCLFEMLSNYKNIKCKQTKPKKIFVSSLGNPYVTVMLCLEAILHNCELTLGIEDVCYGLNIALVKIVQDSLKEQKMPIPISLKLNVDKKELETKHWDKIICLGNSNAYMNLRKLEGFEVKYVPFFDIALYYDSIEFEELVETMRKFALQNLCEIEIFDETEEFEDVVYQINHSLPKFCAVILSKDTQKQESFKREIGSQMVFVNQNPFRQFEIKIPEEIF